MGTLMNLALGEYATIDGVLFHITDIRQKRDATVVILKRDVRAFLPDSEVELVTVEFRHSVLSEGLHWVAGDKFKEEK